MIGPMNKRISTTAADLFVLIDREYRRRKPRDCVVCYVALPYRIDRPEEETANWEVVIPTGCRWGCDLLLEEIVSQFQERYDLSSELRDNVR